MENVTHGQFPPPVGATNLIRLASRNTLEPLLLTYLALDDPQTSNWLTAETPPLACVPWTSKPISKAHLLLELVGVHHPTRALPPIITLLQYDRPRCPYCKQTDKTNLPENNDNCSRTIGVGDSQRCYRVRQNNANLGFLGARTHLLYMYQQKLQTNSIINAALTQPTGNRVIITNSLIVRLVNHIRAPHR